MVSEKIKELEVLIRARYPILYIVSWEEQRIEELLIDIASRREKKVLSWSASRGLTSSAKALESTRAGDEASKDPLTALDQVMEYVEPAIFIFKDFHPYMQEPGVVRKLRDLAFHLKNSYKTLVLIAPVLKIPVELEKDITVVDFDLPALKDLGKLLDQIILQVKDESRIKIDLDEDTREQILKAALGLTLNEAENVFARAIVLNGKLDVQDIPVILSEKQQTIRKTGLLEYYSAQEQFSDVGGMDILKDWLHKRSIAFSEKAREFGLPQPKGILLIGVQGCGKSLCAKAVSSLWRLPLLRLDMGKVFSSLVGSSEENARKAIKIAESVAPAILWIDEIEKAFAGTQSSAFSDAGTTARVFGGFITWLQEKQSPVFVIATANNIELLPPELLRKGRFDEIFFVNLPSLEEREEIFAIHLSKRNRDPKKFDLKELAKEAEGFSGSEIEQAVISALYDAFEAQETLSTKHIMKSIQQTVPLSKTMKENIDGLRKWAATRARMASSVDAKTLAIGKRRLEL